MKDVASGSTTAERLAAGYTDASRSYDSGRPGYPDSILRKVLRSLSVKEGQRVLDLGAGTGTLTAPLASLGLNVTAVEPNSAMREILISRVPQAEVFGSTAEDIPTSQRFDAIFCAQAWHWFDGARVLRECTRLSNVGTPIVLLWNAYNEQIDWVSEYSAIRESYAPSDAPDHRTGDWRRAFEDDPSWGDLTREDFSNGTLLNRQGLLDRMLSSSVIGALPESTRVEVGSRVEALISRNAGHSVDGVFDLQYSLEIWWSRRK